MSVSNAHRRRSNPVRSSFVNSSINFNSSFTENNIYLSHKMKKKKQNVSRVLNWIISYEINTENLVQLHNCVQKISAKAGFNKGEL